MGHIVQENDPQGSKSKANSLSKDDGRQVMRTISSTLLYKGQAKGKAKLGAMAQ